MAKNEPIRRYFYEIEHIRKGNFPSLKDICFYLENRDIVVSERTIERDIEQIRSNFGIEIVYDSLQKGYFVDEELSPNMPSFLRFLEIANTSQILLKGISQTKDFIKDIDFDLRGGLMGTENLTLLLEAIKLKNKIQFTHFSYNTEKTKTVILNPYFLKEYLGRWYIVGLRDDEIRTFGIDRISNLVITKLKFEKTKSQKAKENFDSIIGLIYSEGEQQKVVLSFDPMQGRYVKSLPWHHSQKVLIDNVEELRISLYIVPNFEFYQQILMIGANVKVIEPEWLVAEIKEKLKEALGQYK